MVNIQTDEVESEVKLANWMLHTHKFSSAGSNPCDSNAAWG